MDYNKIRSFCRVFRIAIGFALIAYGVYTIVNGAANYWFFLGAAPLIAGLVNFCPLCLITKKCDLPEAK
jgi:hypothetical protein